ncbi:MAG: tetratricopeptide repeat protein, partial [Abitibacteriaceae bacterium]|nr:tetratricopeptide repeat protein [Abditibacteriaceae bacterium]
QVTASNAPLVARLCQQLEGIPLALELAAARAGSLSVGEMVADLEKRLDVFSSRQSNVATRHRTLRTAIDWSYQLLSPPLRDFFTGLGIFPSGCTAAAVEAVCQVPTALVYLEQLRESSLLLLEENAAESGGGMRFRLLEMIREYALDHLPPERQEELAQRHAAYYLQFAEEANKHLSGPDTRIWLNRLEAEHENLRAALSWSLEQAPDLALQLCGALGQFWQVRGHIHEGRAYLERALTKTPDAAPAQRALALRHLGMLAWSQGDFTRATEVQQQARTLYGLAKDRIGIGKTLAHLSIINRDQGDFVAARALATEALNILQDSEQKLDQAQALFTLGSAACCLNDYLTARSCFAEALSIHRELGNQRGIALLLSNLGAVAGYEGDLTAARRCHEESLALRRELEDKTGIVYSLTDLGNILQQDGDYEQARVLYAESLNMRRELGDRDGMAHTLYLLGLVAAEADDRATARALYLQDLKVLHEISNKGAVMRPLEALARLETVNHSPASLQRAAKLWGAAYACRTASQRLMTPQELTHHEAELAAVRSALGKRAFDRAYQEGSHLTWEQAVDYALNECEAETP